MRKALVHLALAATLLGTAALGVAQERPIGFRVVERTDTARPSKDHPSGRSLQIAVWYPAKNVPREAPPLAFSDYVVLAAPLEGYRGFLARAKVSPSDVDAWLATKMRATRDAPPADGRAPLVLIAQGNGDSASDQAFLAERLASRGFVVATMPSQANLDGPMRSESEIPAQAEAQAADLAFARKAIAADSSLHARGGRYGVVGHSFGARSALLLAMRDSQVTAVVSLDGGIGSKNGKGLLETAKGFDRTRVKAALLHLYEEGDPSMPVDLDLIRSLPLQGKKWLVRVDGMRHVHFSTSGVLAQRIPAVGELTSATPQTGAAWDAVADATGTFLERFVSDGTDRASEEPWSPPASPLLH